MSKQLAWKIKEQEDKTTLTLRCTQQELRNIITEAENLLRIAKQRNYKDKVNVNINCYTLEQKQAYIDANGEF